MLYEGSLLQGRIAGLPALLRPGLEVVGQLADRLLHLVEVGAEAVPGILHCIEQFILKEKVPPTALVKKPTEGSRIKVNRDRGKLLVTDVGADDRALDSHEDGIFARRWGDTEGKV
jgi:hypothetical protein